MFLVVSGCGCRAVDCTCWLRARIVRKPIYQSILAYLQERADASMKTLLLEEYGKLAIADLPMPEPGEHEVLVQVAACGICGSDVHGYDGSSGRRIPPLVMGHEASG